ncbi:MAG TPA: hypothetical protein VEL07_09940 [Planctomycetota bacterium]|nr:hypothetical protein [Planctomycetota bacterium]
MDAAHAAADLAARLRAGEVLATAAPLGWIALARPAERARLLGLPGADPARLAVTAGSPATLRDFLPPHGLRAELLIARLMPGPVALRFADGALARHDAWSPADGPWLSLALSAPPDLPIVGATATGRAIETVVRIDGARLTIEHAGTVGTGRIVDAARVRLLFVCSGNTCRSPMLAALTRHALAARGITGVSVESAGLYAASGDAASAHAVAAMAERGIALEAHRSQPIDAIELDGVDRIWCLGRGHLTALTASGVDPSRLRLVNADAGGVPDPYGGDRAAYDACAAVLERAVDDVIADL